MTSYRKIFVRALGASLAAGLAIGMLLAPVAASAQDYAAMLAAPDRAKADVENDKGVLKIAK